MPVNNHRLPNTWPGISLYACADGVKSAISQVKNFCWHRNRIIFNTAALRHQSLFCNSCSPQWE